MTPVMAELLAEDDTEVFVALGTQRPMTRAEMELKYGRQALWQAKFSAKPREWKHQNV